MIGNGEAEPGVTEGTHLCALSQKDNLHLVTVAIVDLAGEVEPHVDAIVGWL